MIRSRTYKFKILQKNHQANPKKFGTKAWWLLQKNHQKQSKIEPMKISPNHGLPLTRFFRTLGHKYRSKQRSKTSLTALSYAGILLKDVYLIKWTLIRCPMFNYQTRETNIDIY